MPKTLIFAKTDAHAEDIVRIVREAFEQGNDFCQKITYRADAPAQLLRDFQNSAALRIAVTVDMIATGTDVRPLECVFFLRGVSSAAYFEQMKGRGARTIPPDEFRTVTPDPGASKSKFLLVDAVGVTDSPLVDTMPLQPPSQRKASLEQLLSKAASHNISTDEAAALASRLAALDNQITDRERAELAEIGSMPLAQVARGLGQATDPDAQDAARERGGPDAQRALVLDAVRPLAENPELRKRVLDIRRGHDLPYDDYTQDLLVGVEAKDMATEAAESTVADFRQYLAENADQIDALKVAFADLRRDPARVYRQLADLARQIERPPRRWTPERLWEAYRKLGVAQGNGGRKGVPELVSILRYELGIADDLVAYRSIVEQNLANWLARQEQQGVSFTVDQRWFVEQIALVVANRMHVSEETLDDTPFTDHGGVDGFCAAFGDDRAAEVLAELNRELPA